MYNFDQKPNTSFTDKAQRFLQEAGDSEYIVLCGKNNCGKSFLLKTLTESLGEKASYIGPSRYQNFNVLGHFKPESAESKRTQKHHSFLNQWGHAQQNSDKSAFNLQQSIADFTDSKRNQLFEIMELLLGSKMELKFTFPDNTMSQKYISVDGHNISYTSSGYRLITALIASLLDAECDTFLIDEPELGISPEVQGLFSDFLFDTEIRNKYFGHIKTLILATHSTIFLDRLTISNNYFVEKNGDIIDIRRVNSVSEINSIHFFLLGNRFETLYMPSAIVIVEGECDYKYIKRIIDLRYEEISISVIQANGDSRIKALFQFSKYIFGDIQKSPYKDRIFVVLDSVHGGGLVDTLKRMGLPEESIIVWSKNGIEYFYPADIMKSIFHSNDEFAMDGDRIKLNDLEYTKNELVEMVTSKMDKTTVYGQELEQEFCSKIQAIIA
ncbi:MAG: ATP-binding protein [Gammaproteobacteria bacterium]|nr:ATP-binding protein [Gammaproteobacteria bacterium]